MLIGLFCAAPAFAKPTLYAVNFTASWCPNCRVLDPRLAEALARRNDPRVELVALDISDDKSWDASTERAIEKDVIEVHNAYIGTTGLVVLTAADTGERVACITAAHTSSAMEAIIAGAVKRVAEAPRGQRFTGDLMCPKPRPQP